MILEKQANAQVVNEGDSQESIAMSLDLDSSQFLMQILSKNLYSDPIGSVVRELTSNALDSSRRIKTDKPVIVSLKTDSSYNYEFSVEDFGTGLSDDDVRNIISKYGKSTKRDTNEELGIWGIGFKSPLSYTSSFYFITRKDGMERKYMMFEGEDLNTIDLLYESETDKPDGTKVIVPVKYGDRYDFVNKMREQLAYFENVYFDVNIPGNGYIKNDFSIHRNDLFQISEMATDRNMHICLDNVYYSIDFGKLAINTIHVPVGLRFGLGDGLFPTPNREAIRITPESKSVILKRIEEVANYFVTKYNESISTLESIDEAYNYYSNDKRYVKLNNFQYEITSLAKFATVPIIEPTIKGVELISLSKMMKNVKWLLYGYKRMYQIDYRGRFCDNKSFNNTLNYDDLSRTYVYTKLGNNKRNYLREFFNTSTYLVMKQPYELKLFRDNVYGYSYHQILELKKHPKSEWRQRIKEFQHIRSLLIAKIKNADEIEIPQAWLNARKPARKAVNTKAYKEEKGKRTRIKGTIIVKQACDLERFVSGSNCKFESDTYDLAKMATQPFVFIYAKHEDSKKLDAIYKVFNKFHKSMKFITLSNRELKVVNELEIHNLIPYEKFMKGEHKYYRAVVTAYLIDKLRDENLYVFQKMDRIKEISIPLYEKLRDLNKFKNEYRGYTDDKVCEAMVEVATENNLFDTSIHDVYLDVKATLEKLPFLNSIARHLDTYTPNNGDPLLDAMKDLCRYHKFRMNIENYK